MRGLNLYTVAAHWIFFFAGHLGFKVHTFKEKGNEQRAAQGAAEWPEAEALRRGCLGAGMTLVFIQSALGSH